MLRSTKRKHISIFLKLIRNYFVQLIVFHHQELEVGHDEAKCFIKISIEMVKKSSTSFLHEVLQGGDGWYFVT